MNPGRVSFILSTVEHLRVDTTHFSNVIQTTALMTSNPGTLFSLDPHTTAFDISTITALGNIPTVGYPPSFHKIILLEERACFWFNYSQQFSPLSSLSIQDKLTFTVYMDVPFVVDGSISVISVFFSKCFQHSSYFTHHCFCLETGRRLSMWRCGLQDSPMPRVLTSSAGTPSEFLFFTRVYFRSLLDDQPSFGGQKLWIVFLCCACQKLLRARLSFFFIEAWHATSEPALSFSKLWAYAISMVPTKCCIFSSILRCLYAHLN